MCENFKKLIIKYAEGRSICNCGEAYLANCGEASILDENGDWKKVKDYPVCQYGCSANQIIAKEYIAKRVLADLGATRTKYNLKELKQTTTRICELATDARHTFKNPAVNWFDFQCTCAEYYIDDRGDTGYRILVEEASPDNAEIINFIADELTMHGYKDIEIRLE